MNTRVLGGRASASGAHPTVAHVATISPADLSLPETRPIDISHLTAAAATDPGSG